MQKSGLRTIEVKPDLNKIKERRKEWAVCPKCNKYEGRVYEPDGKHQFTCNSCGHHWQYGKTESIYTKLK